MSRLPQWITDNKLGVGRVEVDGETYTYQILSRKLEPALVGFMGITPDGACFISEDVPQRFILHDLTHEVRCKALRDQGVEGGCRTTLERDMQEVPAEMRSEYVRYRRDFFRRLIAFYAKEPDGTDEKIARLKREFALSLEFLEQQPV